MKNNTGEAGNREARNLYDAGFDGRLYCPAWGDAYKRPKVTRESAVAALREAASALGRKPSIDEYEALRRRAGAGGVWWPCPSAVRKLFGSWPKALEAAGLAGLPAKKVLRRRKETACLLARVQESGFPEVPGCERGREFARRLAANETLEEIGRAEGRSREWVRLLVALYLSRCLAMRRQDTLQGSVKENGFSTAGKSGKT